MVLEVGIEGEGLLLRGLVHDTRTLVVRDTLLEEVGLALERDHVHEIEGVGGLVELVDAERDKETIGHKLNVLAHEGGVHADQCDGEGRGQEFLFDLDGLADDAENTLLSRLLAEVRVEQTGKVGVETFVTRDELVAEGQARHQATLLEPEDGRKRAREEDALDRSKGNETLGKHAVRRDPLECPFSLLLDAGNCVKSKERKNQCFFLEVAQTRRASVSRGKYKTKQNQKWQRNIPVAIASKRCSFSAESLMYVSIKSE